MLTWLWTWLYYLKVVNSVTKSLLSTWINLTSEAWEMSPLVWEGYVGASFAWRPAHGCCCVLNATLEERLCAGNVAKCAHPKNSSGRSGKVGMWGQMRLVKNSDSEDFWFYMQTLTLAVNWQPNVSIFFSPFAVISIKNKKKVITCRKTIILPQVCFIFGSYNLNLTVKLAKPIWTSICVHSKWQDWMTELQKEWS